MLIIKKGILDLDKGLTQGLDDTTITAVAKYSINFKQSGKKVLSLHYNRSNSFLYNALNMYQFKAKDSEIKLYPLCLGNIRNYFTINNMRKIGLKGSLQVFSVDYNIIIIFNDLYNTACVKKNPEDLNLHVF